MNENEKFWKFWKILSTFYSFSKTQIFFWVSNSAAVNRNLLIAMLDFLRDSRFWSSSGSSCVVALRNRRTINSHAIVGQLKCSTFSGLPFFDLRLGRPVSWHFVMAYYSALSLIQKKALSYKETRFRTRLRIYVRLDFVATQILEDPLAFPEGLWGPTEMTKLGFQNFGDATKTCLP